MNRQSDPTFAGSMEVAFPFEAGVDIYSVHRALVSRFGGREENAYLWSIQRGLLGDVCLVRTIDGFSAPTLVKGERWLFSLHARIGQKDRTTGRRSSYRRTETARRLRWLERRGAEHGFAVIVAAVDVVREHVRKPKVGFWLDRSEFSGIVEIGDPELVVAAMAKGLGGGRAWGLGMLRLIGKREE